MAEGPERSGTRRFLGCLIKGPAGCLAFFFGAFVVSAVMMPPTCGRAAGAFIEEKFNDAYQGSVEFGDMRLLTFFEEQEIGLFVLRDPEGRDVARGSLKMPSLLHLIEQRKLDDWIHLGDLTLSFVDLVQEEDGETNLARALRLRGEGGERPLQLRSDGSSLFFEFSGSDERVQIGSGEGARAQVSVERLIWSSPETRERGRDVVFESMGGQVLLFGTDGSFSLELEGGIEASDGTRVRVALQHPRLRLDLHSDYFWEGGLELALHSVASHVVQDLVGLPLQDAFGDRFERVVLQRRGARSEARVFVEARGEAASLTLEARWDPDQGRLVADGDDALNVSFTPGSWWTEAWVDGRGPLPLLSNFHARADGPGRLRLGNFVLPLEGGVSAVEGDLDFDLGNVGCDLFWPTEEDPLALSLPSARFRLRLEGGQLAYRGDPLLETDRGELQWRGTYDLDTEEIDLWISCPPDRPQTLHVTGTWDAPEIE